MQQEELWNPFIIYVILPYILMQQMSGPKDRQLFLSGWMERKYLRLEVFITRMC